MTTPIEQDVDVPLRLEPVLGRQERGRGRSSRLVAVGLVSFVVVGIVLGTVFEDGGPPLPASVADANAPSAAPGSSGSTQTTRRPTPTRVPLATPLPTMEILGGQIPTERRLVYANGLQVLDLATGTLVLPERAWEDAVLPLGDDQLVCACVVRGVAANGNPTPPSPLLRFGRFDLSGAPIVERDLLTIEGVVPAPGMDEGFNLVAALSADRRSLFVLASARIPPVWTVELHQVDVETGDLIGTTALDSIPVDLEEPDPSASPRPPGSTPDGIHAWATWLAAAPDGRTVFAAWQLSEVRDENWTSDVREWMIPILDGSPGTPTMLAPEARLKPNGWCVSQPRFLDAELLVQVWTSPEGQSPGTIYYVRQVAASGEAGAELAIPGDNGGGYYPTTPVFDPARRAVLIWETLRHTLTRVGVDDGRIDESSVPESMLAGDGRSVRGWPGADSGLVVSPDGLRLYALGIRSSGGESDRSTGVWVFDADTLALLDHWEPRALLMSLAVSTDGRFVYAAGASGLDVEGRQNPWPASVTVYDAISGEIQVVYGAVGRDIWLSFPSWP